MINNGSEEIKGSHRVKLFRGLKYSALGLFALLLIQIFIPVIIPDIVIGLTLLFLFINILVLGLLFLKPRDWGLIFIVIVLIGLFFRSMRWPLAGVLLTIGFAGLGIFSLFNARLFILRFRNNKFLSYIGFSFSIILSITSLGLLFKNMHWPLAGLLSSIGLGLFIPYLFAFVFTLPASDYINWTSEERKVFFSAIIIPTTFVFLIALLMFVLPEFWNNIMRLPIQPFEMYDFELIDKPGLIHK
ncbi:MAG: hypothetical protein JXR66_03750 [Bacteroidales bacterium]|nr:hypothetical protein [Bacteroidales bacterium]